MHCSCRTISQSILLHLFFWSRLFVRSTLHALSNDAGAAVLERLQHSAELQVTRRDPMRNLCIQAVKFSFTMTACELSCPVTWPWARPS